MSSSGYSPAGLPCTSNNTEPTHLLWPWLKTKPHGGHLGKKQFHQAESEVFLESKLGRTA